jgi:hypothetical protein
MAKATPVQTVIDPADGVALVSVRGAAALTGHTFGTVYRWVRRGKVRVRKVAGSGRIRIEVDSLYTVEEEEPAIVAPAAEIIVNG